MRAVRRAANRLPAGSPPSRYFAEILGTPDATQRTTYHRGLYTVYRGLGDETRFLQFLRRFVGRKRDRFVLEFFGDPDAMWFVPDGVWTEVALPGVDIEDSIARVLARYVVIQEDFDRLVAGVNRTLAARLRAVRASRDFLTDRHERYADVLATGVNPRRPDLQDVDFDALGFDPDVPDAPAWVGYQRYGLLGWGDVGTPVNRHIELPHPDYPFTSPAYADMAGSVEGFAVRAPPRGQEAFDTQSAFIADLRERILDVYLNDGPTAVAPLIVPWNASHLGAHRHGFLTRHRSLVALHQRLNTSFMGRWERYVDFFHRRFGQAYVRSRVLDYHEYEWLPGVRFASRLEYQIFVPDPDFQQRPLLVFHDTQGTLVSPDYTRAAWDQEWYQHRLLMRTEGRTEAGVAP